MLVFDVSGSMAADDVAPSRMEAAKAAATDLVERRPDGVVIGVVAFSDAGVSVQAADERRGRGRGGHRPPRAHARHLAGGGHPGRRRRASSRRGRTPRPSTTATARPTPAPPRPWSPAATPPRSSCVLSDGENNEDPDPLEAAAAAADRGIRIAALGVGTTGGATLDLDGFLRGHAPRRGDAPATRGRDRRHLRPRPTDGDPAAAVYDELARALVVREEPVELTALVAVGACCAGAAAWRA